MTISSHVNKICLYGLSGSGKSTLAKGIASKYNGDIIKIAEPIYEFQNSFYSLINKKINNQDGEFLQFIGYKMEKESPGWLAGIFLDKIHLSQARLIINDDCRFNCYKILKNNEFKFIRVNTSNYEIKKRSRKDHTPVEVDHITEQGFDLFEPDYTIDNNGFLKSSLDFLCTIIDNM